MRECDLLEHIYQANANLPKTVTIPPGDDMAAVRFCHMSALITVDQIADGVHFDSATTPIEKIGRKAITRNLSDVAAMAAVPVSAVVAACLPRHLGQAQTNKLFDAMRCVAESYECPLIGGDIAIWDRPLVLTVTVMASPEDIRPLLRSSATVGDMICVSGQLGGSLETIGDYTHHLDFEPRIALARALGANPDLELHAMIDLSDGLAKDLAHICRASGVGAEILVDHLPVSSAACAISRRDHRPPWEHALDDGEDYELCFTLSSRSKSSLPRQVAGVEITPIGTIAQRDDADQPNVVVKLPDGSSLRLDPSLGWEHGENVCTQSDER